MLGTGQLVEVGEDVFLGDRVARHGHCDISNTTDRGLSGIDE